MLAYQREFEVFHQMNPHVYTTLRTITLQVKASGKHQFGIRAIWERLRWISAFETTDINSDFKLNDHYHSHYARLLMQEPELRGFFRVRK